MTFFCYKDKTGLWKWYLNDDNDEKIAESCKGYWNKRDLMRDIETVKRTKPDTNAIDLGQR